MVMSLEVSNLQLHTGAVEKEGLTVGKIGLNVSWSDKLNKVIELIIVYCDSIPVSCKGSSSRDPSDISS